MGYGTPGRRLIQNAHRVAADVAALAEDVGHTVSDGSPMLLQVRFTLCVLSLIHI